jgi:hypothetical protein
LVEGSNAASNNGNFNLTDSGPSLEQITKDIESLRSLGLLKQDDPFGGLLPDDFTNYDDIVASIVDDFNMDDVGEINIDFDTDQRNIATEQTSEENKDASINIDDMDYHFMMRDCCEDSFLAEKGFCTINRCHIKW